MSKRKKKEAPLTQGGALIQARMILGPEAMVVNPTSSLYAVGIFGEITSGTGDSWETALEKAKESHQAKTWANQQIAEDNELAVAINSLKETAKKVLQEGLTMAMLTPYEKRTVRAALGGAK